MVNTCDGKMVAFGATRDADKVYSCCRRAVREFEVEAA
jgi:hypothetical protein